MDNLTLILILLHRFMLGNGLKRKLDEDGLDEDRRSTAVCSVSQASTRSQRQTVLNMSLMKLYGPRTGPHLALQHKVLIGNIVRRIYADFRREGGIGFVSAAGVTERYVQPRPPFSSSLSALDSYLTPASVQEEALLFPLPSPSTLMLPSQLLEDSEELSLSFSSTDVVVKEEVGSTVEEPDSFLMDSLDDVFSDIESSVPGPCSAPLRAPPSKKAPIFLADDLLRPMSGYDAAGASSQNQPFTMDLVELDHIVEVLVGS